MVRTWINLDNGVHARLRELADRQGRTVNDLVRDAIHQVYMPVPPDNRELLAAFEQVVGLWKDRDDLGDTREYVRRLREGSGRRKKRLGL